MNENMQKRLTKSQVNRLRIYAVRGTLRLYAMNNDDVVLVQHGLVQQTDGYLYSITQLGRDELVARTKRLHSHDTLIGQFAAYLESKNRKVWTNIELKIGNKLLRPDLFSLVCTYNEGRMNPRLFEVKVKRGDFLKGVHDVVKYTGLYQHGFFVTPGSISRKEEIPEPFGLYHQTDSGFLLVKRAIRVKAQKFNSDNWMRLVLKS